MTGFDPVVFVKTLKPASLKEDASSLATLDFPRVPVTQILSGIFLNLFSRRRRSPKKYSRRIATEPAPTRSSFVATLL
jgi:hypothetical protein